MFTRARRTEFLPDGQRKDNLRKPLAGKLKISLKMARDLNHVPLSRKSSKIYNETTIVIKIEGNERAVSHPSRNDRWHEDFDIVIDKANEVEFTIYDTQTGGDPAPIGMLWLRINDIVEALRRQKVGMDGQGGAPAGWVTAETATSMRGGYPAGGNADATLAQNKIEVPVAFGGHDGKSSEGIDGWFAVEPAGALSLHLDFGTSPPRASAFSAPGPIEERWLTRFVCACRQSRRMSASARSTRLVDV
jgi:classical protein kinase C/novel protein kinase C epsilon type